MPSRRHPLTILLALAFAAPLAAQKSAPAGGQWPWGVGPAADQFSRHDLWNLGPLGAKGWDADRPLPSLDRTGGTRRITRSDGNDGDHGPRRLLVRALFPGGPAQRGGLLLDDVVTGVDGQPFAAGCLTPLAAAIRRAEAADGKLVLQVERGGKALDLPVKLKKVGAHAGTPTAGKMARQTLDEALDWLAARQVGGGFPETLGGSNGAVVQTCLAGLAWIGGGSSLAKGRHKANLAAAASFVLRGLDAPPRLPGGDGGNWDQTTWSQAHAALFLGELQLASGGKKPSAELQRIADTLGARQEASGGYAHGPGGKNALGYLELNILAAYVASGLSVAHQAGCKVDPGVLDKLFGYAEASGSEDGGVGYSTADGQRGMGNIGRTAGTWLAARGLGRGDLPFPQRMATYVKAHVADVLGGHASLQQHILLAGLAASALGGDAVTAYWSGGLGRDLVLARAPDGSLQPRPWHESLSMQSNTDVSVGEVWSTASWAIVLGALGEPGKGGLPAWCGQRR